MEMRGKESKAKLPRVKRWPEQIPTAQAKAKSHHFIATADTLHQHAGKHNAHDLQQAQTTPQHVLGTALNDKKHYNTCH